jgi:dolichol-phosphate mannosyltransferase
MATELVTRMGDALRALRARMDHPEVRRFVRFGIVGGSGVVVNLGCAALGLSVLFTGVADPDLQKHLSVILGIVVSVFTNFVINDRWTWADRSKHGLKHWFGRFGRYYLAASFGVVVQWAVAFGLHEWLDWHILLTDCFGIGAAVLINYQVNNRWTFREVGPRQ